MTKLERHLAGRAVENLTSPDWEDHFKRYFGYCKMMAEFSDKHDERLYGIMVDLYKYERKERKLS